MVREHPPDPAYSAAMAERTIRAAVVGTGFIGVVHVEALRRLGVEVTGVVGSTKERAEQKVRALGLPPAYDSFEAMLADERVDVVHLTTPNHLHYPQVKQVLAARKHVVCEKPLAVTAAESGELVQLAKASGLVHCVNFNQRYYPLVQHARAVVQAGEIGDVYHVHGGYLQDWLLLDTDWNWRLEPDKGGELRAVGDIGSHWLDLIQHVTGLRVEAVMAELTTFLKTRRRPEGEVESFTSGGDVPRREVQMSTEDSAHLLIRLSGGARGAVVVSQVSAGRKNSLNFEIDGSAGSIAWNSERCEEIFLGHRERPNELLIKDSSLMKPLGAANSSYPPGHAEGFPDTFKQLYRKVYAAVEQGEMPADPDFPPFEAGHLENVIGEAILQSSREGRWVTIEEGTA
jgi:predicted dehydrogenase